MKYIFFMLNMNKSVFSLCQTFNVLPLLTLSKEVNDVFWVGQAVHKLLTKARSVKRLKTSTVVHLAKAIKRINSEFYPLEVQVQTVYMCVLGKGNMD